MGVSNGELKKDYVYRCILERINNGHVDDGRFPSELEFCKEFGVSRVTLRAALKRLEQEGMITRSHYYGTRIAQNGCGRILIASAVCSHQNYDRMAREIFYIEAACRNLHHPYEMIGLHFLQDPEKLAEKYCGIIFSGAEILGDEPFIDVIRKSGLPAVYRREDEINVITDTFPSVGVDMNKAWWTGFDYLVSLGFRRIMTLISNDARSYRRLGITKGDFSSTLRKRGLTAASQMVCNIPAFEDANSVKELIRELNPEAIYCYSDYVAALVYRYLAGLGKRIPQDVAVLGFDCGSDLVTPSLSSVSLVSPLFGTAVVSLLLHIYRKKSHVFKPLQLNLPFSIYEAKSTAKIALNNLIQ